MHFYLAGPLYVKGIHNVEMEVPLQPQDIIVPSMQDLAPPSNTIWMSPSSSMQRGGAGQPLTPEAPTQAFTQKCPSNAYVDITEAD